MKPIPGHPIPVISPTSVADLDCPKKFWITRVLRLWPPRPHNLSNTATEFGTAFHEVMRGL